MEGKRGPSGGPGEGEPVDPSAGGQGPSDPAPPPGEQFGPLEVRRLRKEDGRSLIVYARIERGP